MTKKCPIYLIVAIIATIAIGCNSDPIETETLQYDNVAVTGFSLQEDDSVLANLDSVFFSIDLNNALIYNADSLPKGTKINRLLVTINTSMVSGVDITMSRVGQNDTTINYLTNPNDSIDFSNGPVTVRITSYDKTVVRDYKVKVNVHEMEPDSLYWNELAKRDLPTSLGIVTKQKAVDFNGQAVVLASDGTAATVAVTSNPGDNNWIITNATLPAGADVNSFTASDDALYIVGGDGMLYTSDDFAANWASTGVSMGYIYGAYGNVILGNRKTSDGSYLMVTYPASTEMPVADTFPVSGTSTMLKFTNEWSTGMFAVMAGGRDAEGIVRGDAWGYDGSSWARLSDKLPALEGMSILPYYSFRVNSNNWKATKFSTIIAMGGRDRDGEVHKDVYMTIDQGMHWSKAGQLLQLPGYIPAFSDAQALVFETVMHARSGANVWKPMESVKLPAWYRVMKLTSASRAVAPVTQWDCPYIYMFGGYAADGSLHDTVWRGVINRLSFKPLY